MHSCVLIMIPNCRQLNEEHKQRSLEDETLWLRLRSLTLRLIGCVSALTHPPTTRNSEKTTENGVATKPSSLQSLLSQLENTLNQATQFTEKQLQVRTRYRPLSKCVCGFVGLIGLKSYSV
ncbi:N-alpha-acetyltransferase 25, NatB auxiliary subunit [Labeo rohita]|uniref:N-alpha-acetyltransferase 25, NatB auxiliary subunit n=1 Tax=Labeo rohita TaxID=84645 RepID=A0ABQ8MBL4_LABRO|nr:N-alpha-acetyltransferase 25, NatB auxiliary subunit [Labeo rohita]